MQIRIIKKSLVIGIIFIFIGVGIQPAFAIDISNNKQAESEEDCKCQVDDDYSLVRIKSLLNRAERLISSVEIFTKLIPILSKDIPEVSEDFEELSEKITTFREKNEELKSATSGRDFPIICDILEILDKCVYWPLIIFEAQIEELPDGSLIGSFIKILYGIFYILANILTPFSRIFNCWEGLD